MSRVDKILGLARRNILDEGADILGNDDGRIAMDDVQFDICDRAFALKAREPFTLVVGQGVYPTNMFRIASITIPASWGKRPKIFQSVEDWTEFESLFQTNSCPLGIFSWNKELLMWPAPSVADELNVYGYIHPRGEIELGGDPEIGREYDELMMLGVVARYMAQPKISTKIKARIDWPSLYEAKLKSMRGRNTQEMLGPVTVGTTIDRF
jgi:hypothetical protein